MSLNRENVTWQNPDGKWRLGFFVVIEGDYNDPDYDYEWDVDYDYGSFEWVSRPAADAEAAYRQWDGCNPGGSDVWPYSPETAEQCKEYERMAQALTSGPLRSRYVGGMMFS